MQRPLRREFLVTLIETSRHLRHFVDLRARRYGITGAQVRVLSWLGRREGMTQAELASELEMRPISLGSLIDKLARQDLVERRRDDKDRRINRLYLTRSGKNLADKLDDFREEIARDVFHDADEAALKAALDVLAALKSQLQVLQKLPALAAE